MRLSYTCLLTASFVLPTAPCAAQTAAVDSAANVGPTSGRPENRWRYRFFEGRWWYWTADNQWSFFNGNRWAPYRPAGDYVSRKVDPALLRLEAKEGVAGPRTWPRLGGGAGASGMGSGGTGGNAGGGGAGTTGGGWSVSGTRGSLGGAPSGSFTTTPGLRTGVNTAPGTNAGTPSGAASNLGPNGAPAGMGGVGQGR